MASLIATSYMSIARGLTKTEIIGKLSAVVSIIEAERIVTEAAYEFSAANRQSGKRWDIDGFLFAK